MHANFHVTLAYAFALPILKIPITASRLYMDNYFDGFAIRKGWKNEETGGLWTLCGASLPLESEVLVHTVELLAA